MPSRGASRARLLRWPQIRAIRLAAPLFHFRFPAEIDQFSVDAVARCAPPVFVQKTTPVNPESGVSPEQFEKLGDDRLNQCRNRERVVYAGLGIAHAHLERIEERMQPDVPPDFFRVVDATGFDQSLQ